MTTKLPIVAVILIIAPLALTQDDTLLPRVSRSQTIAVTSIYGTERPMSRLPFCPRKNCLYYAGDYDSTNYNANVLFNADTIRSDVAAYLVGRVWVGVKPSRTATVTGATFNQLLFYEQLGTNPTPFAVQVGIKPGQAGKTVCSTTGNATVRLYQGNQQSIYSYTIKKLSRFCKLRKGTVYYVNLLPTYIAGGYGFVVDVEDAKPANHRGWKNIPDNSYFDGVSFGANYQPTWGTNGACGGFGCDLFSIALTGTE